MIMDPYQVLGVTSSASNDELKKAYRELSRKYHPDAHVNNPLSDLAEDKFKEVQEAYEQIMKDRERGYSQGGSAQGNYSSGSGQDSPELNEVYIQLSARRYRDALNVLSRISNRTARWYYYSAVANAGIGNNIEANNHAQQAARMEPNNREYTDLVNQMGWKSQRYQNTSYNNGRPAYGTGNLCCDLWCADSLCECMGGDLCSCM